ncbi:unnamed protein product, partial [Prunus brigantina]
PFRCGLEKCVDLAFERMSFKKDADPRWSMGKGDKLSKTQETSEGSRMESGRKIRTTRSFKASDHLENKRQSLPRQGFLIFFEVRFTDVRVESDLHLNWVRHEADVHGGNNELS